MAKESETLYKELLPALELFEIKRQEAKTNQTRLNLFLFVIFMLTVFLLTLKFLPIPLKVFIGLGVAIAIIGTRKYYYNQYLDKFKKDMMEIIFGRKNTKIVFNTDYHIQGGYISESAMFETTNTYSGKNHIQGSKGSTLRFECSLLNAGKEEGEDYTSFFNGFFFSAILNKRVPGNLIAYSKDFESYGFIPHGGLDLNTAIEKFNKNFLLSYSDQDIANRILTEDLINKLIKLREEYSFPFVFKIENNRIYFGANKMYKFLDLDIYFKADEEHMITKFEKDCQFILDLIQLIEDLNLKP